MVVIQCISVSKSGIYYVSKFKETGDYCVTSWIWPPLKIMEEVKQIVKTQMVKDDESITRNTAMHSAAVEGAIQLRFALPEVRSAAYI